MECIEKKKKTDIEQESFTCKFEVDALGHGSDGS